MLEFLLIITIKLINEFFAKRKKENTIIFELLAPKINHLKFRIIIIIFTLIKSKNGLNFSFDDTLHTFNIFIIFKINNKEKRGREGDKIEK